MRCNPQPTLQRRGGWGYESKGKKNMIADVLERHSMTGNYYCPRHRLNGILQEDREPRYTYPYALGDDNQFTYGVEIELESQLPEDFVKNVVDSDLIAGWNNDPSLGQNGVELQSNILDMSKLSDLRQLVEGIPDYGENAGGHIHVARTANQCASRWYWALRGLDAPQCEHLNMRHMSDDYWCELSHGEYRGKHTAVNNEHQDTIELRTFDCWYEGSAAKLVPAVKWIRAMWRFFEKHPRGTVEAETIEQYASCMADNVTDTPFVPLERRLEAARSAAAAAAHANVRTLKYASITPHTPMCSPPAICAHYTFTYKWRRQESWEKAKRSAA